MALIDDLIAACKDDRAKYRDLVEQMEGGKFRAHEFRDGKMHDTTIEDTRRYKQKIAELDALIARHPERGS